MMKEAEKVNEHYSTTTLRSRLETALNAAGLESQQLTPELLAPLDQFHSRGLAATVDLANAAGVSADKLVLDIGSGLGGPSRYLANKYGCRVRGVDLNEHFVDAATYLTKRAGVFDKVAYQAANALSLPFDNGVFDIVWTQHVAMNIGDRDAFYTEARRVLKPAGKIAIYDVIDAGLEPLHYPVPWARTAETSFLVTAEHMRTSLERCGFVISSWIDQTQAGVEWFRAYAATLPKSAEGAALSLDIVMGEEFNTMTANFARNLMEGRIGLAQVVAEVAR
ncbi:methyltransferase domain-containing protein [Paraburkholderia caribensis]|uniref:methyltransferase domain-containing protein n=1 Tax=Paraburkholderia caribensis TaxID=75105 RepID=UPI0034D2A94C